LPAHAKTCGSNVGVSTETGDHRLTTASTEIEKGSVEAALRSLEAAEQDARECKDADALVSIVYLAALARERTDSRKLRRRCDQLRSAAGGVAEELGVSAADLHRVTVDALLGKPLAHAPRTDAGVEGRDAPQKLPEDVYRLGDEAAAELEKYVHPGFFARLVGDPDAATQYEIALAKWLDALEESVRDVPERTGDLLTALEGIERNLILAYDSPKESPKGRLILRCLQQMWDGVSMLWAKYAPEQERLERRKQVGDKFGHGAYSVYLTGMKRTKPPDLTTVQDILSLNFGIDRMTSKSLVQRAVFVGRPQLLLENAPEEGAIGIKQALEPAGARIKIAEAADPSVSQRRSIPERVRHEVWRRDGGRCVDCGSRENLEFDHIIALSRGGSNTARNIELRCQTCNRKKGATV
jgi:hypothetical protein